MKPTSLLAPLLITALGGVWLAWQQQQISTLESKTSVLNQRLDAAAPAYEQPASKMKPVRKTALDAEDVDWALVVEELGTDRVQFGIYTSAFRLEEQIRRLSASELKEALNAVETSRLDDKALLWFTGKLLGLLLDKDPGYILLEASKDSRTAEAWKSMRLNALGKWSKSTPVEAQKWFDFQPEGTFEPEEHGRLKHGLISSLLVSDFPSALQRFSAIDERDRSALFMDLDAFGSHWTVEDFAELDLTFRYAELTRLLPEDKQSSIVSPLTWLGEQDRPAGISSIQENLEGWRAQRAEQLSMEVFRDYLSKIKPSAQELELCINEVVRHEVLQLANQPEREPDALRDWLRSELQSTIQTE